MNTPGIENLKKVTLLLEAGTTADVCDLTPAPVEFEFIFGLGTEGLTPFEYELANKTEGDKISLCLKQEKFAEMLRHLRKPLCILLTNLPDIFYLNIQVRKVVPAENTEVVKALSEAAQCEGHSCGDSCCGHF